MSNKQWYYLGVVDVHRETSSRDPEDGRIIEEAGETLCVQCSTGHQHLQVATETGDVFYETKQDICVEGALMGFINNDHARWNREDEEGEHIMTTLEDEEGEHIMMEQRGWGGWAHYDHTRGWRGWGGWAHYDWHEFITVRLSGVKKLRMSFNIPFTHRAFVSFHSTTLKVG